jgi:hypothetical protein
MVRLFTDVIKVPRQDPLPDFPAFFPPLKNLHLELLEDKDKLKSGLPLIPPDKASEKLDKLYSIDDAGTFNAKSKPSPKRASIAKEDSGSELVITDGDEIDNTEEDALLDSEEESDTAAVDDEEREFLKELGDDASEISEPDQDEPSAADEKESEVDDDPYAGLTPEERERMEKEEYLWRFRILRKGNQGYKIPEFNEHSDLHLMKKAYDSTVREIVFDKNIAKYRKFLAGSFMAVEFACIQKLGIDMKGFALQQSKEMDTYDALLVELGEKQYGSIGANLPVEIKLIGLVLFQAGLFYLGKVISDKYGSSVGEMFRGFSGKKNNDIQFEEVKDDQPPPRQGRKMRGPKIRAEDV